MQCDVAMENTDLTIPVLADQDTLEEGNDPTQGPCPAAQQELGESGGAVPDLSRFCLYDCPRRSFQLRWVLMKGWVSLDPWDGLA